MDGVNLDSGPGEEDWYKTEVVAKRFYDFYMGTERIFKRIAQKIDGEVSEGADWHKELLKQMEQPVAGREAVISRELRKELMDFLAFRHVWVKAYGTELNWPKMKKLAQKFPAVYSQSRREILNFLENYLSA